MVQIKLIKKLEKQYLVAVWVKGSSMFISNPWNSARSEKRLLIIRNLQSEKIIVNKQEEFYLSKGKFLQIRKKIPADKEIFPLQKEISFWQVKLFLFIDNCLLTLQIPDYQQVFFWACVKLAY